MNLSMSTEEIKSRYKSMKPTQDRLQILADLNGCEKKTIQAVLDGHEPAKPKLTHNGTMLYHRWTAEDEQELIEMVKAGKTVKEAADRFVRSVTAVKAKAETLGHPFSDRKRKTRRAKCESGVCAVPKVGEVIPAVGEIIPAVGEILFSKPEPAKTDYAETAKNLSMSMEFITDQLNQIIQYADNLRQENDRLTRQLARVREAVE